MKKFEIGKAYKMHSPCDHNCIWSYIVVGRTAATITISDGKERKTCRISKRISEYRQAESIAPLGSYSMAPILSADKEICTMCASCQKLGMCPGESNTVYGGCVYRVRM